MNQANKTRELLQELEEMRRKNEELEACRRQYDGIRQRYENLIEAAPDAMIFVNRDYEIVLVNAQMERLFGYAQKEVVGKRLDILIPERFRKRHRGFVADFFSNPRVRAMGSDLRIYGLKKDGAEFRADISLSPMQVEGGLLATAAIRDITERVEAQELIERNYHIQRVINELLKVSLSPVPLDEQLDRALDLILSVPYLAPGSKGSIYLAAEGGDELILKTDRGLTAPERAACGRVPFGRCLCGRAAAECELIFSECIDEGHEIRFEGMLPHGHYCVPIVSGENPLGVITIHLEEMHKRDSAEEAFLSAVADTLAGVIERRRAEEEKRRLQEQLVQSEKLAALGRIAANVAHEIRNPLTSVGGFARRLLKKIPGGTTEREYADSIVSEVAALENILRDVLAYAAVSVLNEEETNIIEVLDRALAAYEKSLKEHAITIERSYGETPAIRIDRERVKEVVGNLLSNAVEAMPGGGTINVSAFMEAVRETPYVAVRISDTGEGIPEEMLDKVFEPFFTTRVAKRGIGLGLPICRRIMEEHGGFITVQSTVGNGTAFAIYFPVEHPGGKGYKGEIEDESSIPES